LTSICGFTLLDPVNPFRLPRCVQILLDVQEARASPLFTSTTRAPVLRVCPVVRPHLRVLKCPRTRYARGRRRTTCFFVAWPASPQRSALALTSSVDPPDQGHAGKKSDSPACSSTGAIVTADDAGEEACKSTYRSQQRHRYCLIQPPR
jgi:hypothetical protein